MPEAPYPVRKLASGNEAVAWAAFHANVHLGTGYPGTPSTEILEVLDRLGGKAQWAPNEKVALEVGIGAAFAGARALITMKHVGLNVAADALFTVAYTGVSGGMVIVSADDPGMASSQNEQDNRRYAVAAGIPMLEPSDSQEAYAYTLRAFALSERWQTPVLLRLTTRVCHSATILELPSAPAEPLAEPHFVRDIAARVMIPAHARPAHQRLRARLADIAAWNDAEGPNVVVGGDRALGIITSGIAFQHVREASPGAKVLKLGLTHPLPLASMRAFAASVERCLVVEEGDPFLYEAAAAAGIRVEGKPDVYRLGELSVSRVQRIIDGDVSPEPSLPTGKPPELCPGCPHRNVFAALHELDCIVAGDIGCYTLGVLPPFSAMDTCVCMGAAIGVGLGLRHVLPPAEACRVVSVIGDSTFIHSGITGMVEMVYNPPATGHVVIILDNGTTAMTGLQEHPGTGRRLNHQPTGRVVFEDLARALGLEHVMVIDPVRDVAQIKPMVKDALARGELTLIVARRPCLLAAGAIKARAQAENV